MSKWFEVKIEVVQTVAVEVADDQGENEARDAAIDEIGLFSADVTDSTTTHIFGTDAIARSIRFADKVSRLPKSVGELKP